MNLNNGDDFCISTRNDVVPCDENWQDLLGFYSGVLQDEIVPLATTTYDVPANFETNNVQNVKYNNVPQKINSLAELIGNDSQKNQDLDGYNLHQMIPHSRLPVSYRPSYNLNLPASPEVAESSTAARPSQLAPTTPDQQKQTKNYQIIQTPHLSIEDISPQENDVVLHQRLEFVDTEHNALGTSSATPKDKQTFDGEIDLNKTPTQKTPKRRKHRPKVVIEGKPKRTPKPKATPPDGNTTTKRKYVRRKGIQTTTNQASDAATEVGVSNHDSIAKSCKRALNFDLETGVEKKSQRKDNEVNKVSFNLNEASDNAEWCAELNEQSNSAAKQVHQENLNEFVHSVDKTSPQETFVLAATEPQAASRDRTLNIIARSLNVGNAYINQSGDQGKHGEVHNRIGGSLAQLVIQANTSERNLQTSSQRLEDMVNVDEKQRSQREYSYIDLTQPLMGSQIRSYGVVETSHYNVESCKLWQNGSESSKTKKVEDKITGTSSSMPFGNIQSYESSPSGGLPYSGGNSTSCLNVIDEINKVTRYWNTNTEDSRDGIQKQVKLYEMVDSPARMPVKKQTEARQTSSKKTSTKDKVLQQKTKNIQGHGHYSKKVTGLQEDKMTTVFVDFITDRMKDLRIDNNGNETAGALVPYRADGAVVPYEVFDPIKKRRTRPKVDLDPETSRLWSLLMGKEGSDGAETMDNDKHVRWEEERKVFRGRVDSFISQMHLVQGDRRFSKWKGSVVDSVIGVFLTQNVSDHLSSSAFMSLAAKFPIKSTTIRETCCLNMGNPSFEREVLVTFPDGTSYDHRTINETTYDSNVNPERTFLMNNHTRRMDQGMISSQGSSESIVYKASEDIKSSSGSNSEPEDRITRSNNHGSLNLFERIAAIQQYLFPETESPLITYQQPENPYSYPSTCSWQKMTTSLEKWEADNAMLGKQSTSSFTSTDFGITNGTRIERAHDKAGLISESSLTAQQTRQSKSQPDTGQRFIDYRGGGMQETFQQDNAFQTEPTRSAEAFSKQLSDDPKQTENMKKVHSPNVSPSKIGTSPNARKRKAEKEKAEPFDWDTLRKEVQSNGGTGGRSMDTMDSLDYETLRNADVRQISEAIKERGMNNMLAERIKDFLNRLVRDHGQVDLEWLRNVQPDKVKDYLLSIRGLGLKSVECVRLLTLHHLAFPVDTNVGRIAVRLGWVPLQPLPESLQLHLLELYPVLESIQKYLWPRLCMLDQETLYELHYQMITFGKVFCTKREPNCNACPLRAQCRHFASAFASARLALPSPEEGRIVTSSSLRNFNSSSSVGINSLLLPPSENQTMGSTRNCEPIIEEPTTPELPAEMSEQDIEDVFYEDPNEIPVININIQEFTTNLQNIIQENMDMQEGDMSKALVALSPQLASIPMPKLKHISRLRTEHQVYELSDSHPLLKGLDRREPDDPSPYLLAIWTPGETADSVQPPESKCSSLEGGLCNNETCFSCNSTREAQAQTVRGTILTPCRTAMRGSFPLNGTYFQVNEVFADHESSMKPIDVPRSLIWNLSRRKVFFGTSVSTIFKGMSTDDIQQCFWRGFVCVRGFEQKSRAPRPLMARFHLPASKMAKKSA